MKLPKIFLSFLFLLFISCNGQQKEIKKMEPKEFSEKLQSENQPQLIDVRSPKEFSDQHLDNAKNINWNGDDFEQKVVELDKSKPIYVYCLSGGRSSSASKKLAEMGFKEIYEMDGGIVKWNASGLAKKSNKTIGMTLAEYEKLLVSDKKILINFYADWCAPCVKMKPYITKMQKDLKNVTIIRLDADANKTLLTELKIEELPTLLLYENKEVKWKHSGFISEEDLTKKL
ncbi:MAG: redoxin domain-containing protein [Flavobacterium sp.]|nr:MAG: redoxin domain-containing protein [Flavobacterium sp.]